VASTHLEKSMLWVIDASIRKIKRYQLRYKNLSTCLVLRVIKVIEKPLNPKV